VLTASLRDARAGRTRFVLLTGEAGVGKTRTIEELVRHAERFRTGALGPRARAHRRPELWPWIRAVETYAAGTDSAMLREQLDADAPILAHSSRLAATLPDVEPLAPSGSDAEARFRLLDAMTSFLRAPPRMNR
jgi:predicted ATPase